MRGARYRRLHTDARHYGPSPHHGGLTQHHGARRDCPGPECGPEPHELPAWRRGLSRLRWPGGWPQLRRVVAVSVCVSVLVQMLAPDRWSDGTRAFVTGAGMGVALAAVERLPRNSSGQVELELYFLAELYELLRFYRFPLITFVCSAAAVAAMFALGGSRWPGWEAATVWVLALSGTAFGVWSAVRLHAFRRVLHPHGRRGRA